MPVSRQGVAERFIGITSQRSRGWLATLPYRGRHGAPRWRLEPFHALLEQLGPLNGDRVLDVGCGGGRLIELLLAAGARDASGLDHNPRLLGIARRRNRVALEAGRVELKDGDAHALCWPDHSFSLVMSVNLLSSLAEPRRALSEWLRVLRPGGRLALSTIRGPGRSQGGGGWVAPAQRLAMHVYDDDGLCELLCAAGFDDVQVHGDRIQLAVASRPRARLG